MPPGLTPQRPTSHRPARLAPLRRRALLAGLPALVAQARAQEGLPIVRIGVLWDRTGMGSATSGPDQVVAAQLAVADFGRLSRGYQVEILSAGFERRPDQALAIARDWFEKQGVAAIVDVPGTAAPLLVRDLGRDRDRTVMNTGSVSAALTGPGCSPTGTHWIEDTSALTLAMTAGMAVEGVRTWFLVVPDDATGLALKADATAAIEGAGGRVTGFARHPADGGPATLALTSARASGADAVGLCAMGETLVTHIRGARALGLFEGNKAICAYAAGIGDIHALRADEARGLRVVTSFWWKRNEWTKSFANRFYVATERMPDRSHAATYAAIGHFLRQIETADTLDGGVLNIGLRREAAWFFGGGGRFRPDGRLMLDMGLYRVKPRDDAAEPWDYYEFVRTIPALQAFRASGNARCVP